MRKGKRLTQKGAKKNIPKIVLQWNTKQKLIKLMINTNQNRESKCNDKDWKGKKKSNLVADLTHSYNLD